MPKLSTVEAMTPDAFLDWWRRAFQPGTHVLTLGQTGSGKTVLELWLASVRKYCVLLDAKGGADESVDGAGWERVERWPLPQHIRQAFKDGEPVRIVLGKLVNKKADWGLNQELLAKAVGDLWLQKRWTVLADELQLLADKRFAGGKVGNDLEMMLIAARARKISIMSTFQRPAISRNTPAAGASISQSTFVFVSMTRDRQVHQRISEVVGRPLPETEALMTELPRFTWACYSLDPQEPIRLVQPPKPRKVHASDTHEPSKFGRWMWGAQSFRQEISA